MNDPRPPSPSQPPAGVESPAPPRPAYEAPRIVMRRAVSRVTLFSGGGGTAAPSPLVANG
jgi:hypothetical protein